MSEGISVGWQSGDRTVVWEVGSHRVTKTFAQPPRSVVAWHEPPSVIIVEAPEATADPVRNAVVYDVDGSERVRLVPPDIPAVRSWGREFYVVYPEPAGLVAVFSTNVGDFWGRPDLVTGELRNVSEWR